jgi:hypothetical protein
MRNGVCEKGWKVYAKGRKVCEMSKEDRCLRKGGKESTHMSSISEGVHALRDNCA